MRTPLLAAENDTNGLPPSLSAGPDIAEESEFSQLIAQQQQQQQQQQQGPSLDASLAARLEGRETGGLWLWGDMPPPPPSSPRATDWVRTHTTTTTTTRLVVLAPRGPVLTAVAGTLSFLHLCFVWASYLSDSWAESCIRISIAWQTQYLPWMNNDNNHGTEQVIRSTNLTTLFQDLGSSHNYLLMFLLWTVSLLLPCVFMIVSPTFVLFDHTNTIFYTNRCRSWNLRGTLETSMRWSFMTFYVLLVLSLATSFMEFQWTDTTIQAGNRLRGPFAAYVTGIACAVGVAVLLRYPSTKESMVYAEPLPRWMRRNGEISLVRTTPPPPPPPPPPPQAFQYPWLQPEVEPDDEPTMTVLEETSHRPRREPLRVAPLTNSTPSTPELVSENGDNVDIPPGLGFWNKFAAFQLGLLSVFLWIPAVYLPTLSISYGGVATNFLVQHDLRLYIWEFSVHLWQQGAEFQTTLWILFVATIGLWLTTLVLPLLATFLAVLAWLGDDGPWTTKCYSWLYALHPALGGLVLSLSLLLAVQALTPYSTSLLEKESAGLCEKFHQLSGERCLEISARMLPGFWFYVLQSLVLELFVTVTLRWA